MNQSVRNNRLPADLTGAVSGPVSSQSGFEGVASIRYSGGPRYPNPEIKRAPAAFLLARAAAFVAAIQCPFCC
jgi:hypothetical protein